MVGQCATTAKGNRGDISLPPETIIGKLKGANPAEVEKTLDYIIQKGTCNPRFIRPLLDLLSSHDPVMFGKALTALMLMRENGVRFAPEQERALTKRLNGAQIQFVDGGLKISGSGVRLPNGAVLDEGSISFKDGQWLLMTGSKAVISGVQISAETRNVNLFFDDRRHESINPFIAIDANHKTITLHGNDDFMLPEVKFRETNPFVRIEGTDELALSHVNNADVRITNRDANGLVPAVDRKSVV